MNLAMLTSQIPLIELGVITSFVLMHLARIFLGLSQSSIAGTFFIVVCTILLLLPFNSLGAPWSLPLVAYVRGVTGELSIVTMMLILFTWSSAPAYRLSSVTPLIIAFASFLFYPFALGLTMFDPYSWGYGSIIFVVAVMMMALLFFFTKRSWEALTISLAVIAWSIHWHESTNLWDYLLDPFLAVWAIIISIRWIIWGRPEPYSYSAWDIDSSVLARRKQGKIF
ncbi:MAG: hypothetical protein K9J26_06450, partial [Limnohabitans sp.]|nr:hypothetical protein [Limnohabitans sp.]